MIRVAHLSDSHFDARGDLEDVVRVHHEFIRQARDAKVDLVVHAGDWFDRESSPIEREALAGFLHTAMEHFPVFGVKGNHDAARDLPLFNLLEGSYPCTILERPSPMEVQTYTRGVQTSVMVLPLPWFDKASVAAALGPEADQGQTRLATIEQARALLASFKHHADRAHAEGMPVILVGHVMVAASVVASGQVLLGHGVELTPMDLRLSGADFCAIGHVHKHQAWENEGHAPVVYSGSPTRHDHGEPEDKGFVIADFYQPGDPGFEQNGYGPLWHFHKLPARELYHIDIDATRPEQLAALRDHKIPGLLEAKASGARVRLRYKVAAEDLASVDAEALRAILSDLGAHDVKVEAQPLTIATPRAAEVAAAQSLGDKVRAYLVSKGLEERWERIAPLLSRIEAD